MVNKKQKNTGISFFEKYLTIWVALCMVAGILIGRFLPAIPEFLGRFEYAQVSIPIAILIWLMIYPMMMKVDFASIRYIALATIAGVLVEVPVMLALVKIANQTTHWFPKAKELEA